jgi:hypothetical protein
MLIGLLQKLSQAFEVPPDRVQHTSTSDRMAKLKAMFGDNPIVFPVILTKCVLITRGDQAPNGYNAIALHRAGLYHRLSDDANRVTRIHPVPITLDVEVAYLTNDYFGGLDFGALWMSNGLARRLNMTIDYYNLPIDIRVELGSSMDVPEQDAAVANPNFYTWQSGIIMQGYFNDPHLDGEEEAQMLRAVATELKLTSDVPEAVAALESSTEFSAVR